MKNKNRNNSLVTAGIGLLIIVLLNIAGSIFFTRFDLTSEKRHTLTRQTVEMVKKLDDVVFIKVYLEGDFPADFKRLRNAVRERLDELRAYAGDKIEYEFINPSENPDPQIRQQTWQKLMEAGLEPTEITIKGKDALEKKLIFPGALLSYRDKEIPMQILRSQERIPSPEMLNNSINNLEYNIANNIRRLTVKSVKKIAVLAGHGEADDTELEDFLKSASDLYEVKRVSIDSQLNALSEYKCLVVAKPDSTFSEKDKFIIDQFIMRGGRVLWCLDGVSASMDSIQKSGGQQTMGFSLDINLDDMLFNYGARINKNLLIDRSCAPIALNVGKFGDQPNMKLFPWYFFPVIIPTGKHPVTQNLDPVNTEFVSDIDTVGLPFITKTILLTTSPYTRIMRSPVRINLGLVGINPDFTKNSVGPQAVAVLLEGKFRSLYFNRIAPAIANSKEINFRKEVLLSTKMIVIADGDVIVNKVDRNRKIYYPLGYDRFLKQKIYGNKELLMNSLNYLLDDSGLIAVRSREIKLRKLDEEKLAAGRVRWQIINVVMPILTVILMGVFLFFIRKKKFAR